MIVQAMPSAYRAGYKDGLSGRPVDSTYSCVPGYSDGYAAGATDRRLHELQNLMHARVCKSLERK